MVLFKYQSRMAKTICPIVYAPIRVKQGTTVMYPVKIKPKIEIAVVKLITLKPLAIAALLSAIFLSSFSSISISLDFLMNKSQVPEIINKIPISEVPITIKSGRGTGINLCTPKPYVSNPPSRMMKEI